MKKRILAMMTAFVLLVSAGCAAPGATTGSSAPQGSASGGDQLKVAMVCSGPINDGSWNTEGYNGLEAVKEKFNAEITYNEQVPIDSLPTVLRTYGREGYDIVFAHSVEYDEQMKRIAPEFPDTKFVTINGSSTDTNLYSAQFSYWELMYFLGMAGALMSESNQISMITAMDTPTHRVELKAFETGAQYANPDCVVSAAYTGDWADLTKAREASLAQIAAGNDVLLANVSSAASAILGACQEEGAKGLGWGVDMSPLADDTVIVSGLFAMPDLYIGVVESILSETDDRVLKLSMRDNYMSMGEMADWVPEEVAQAVSQRVEEFMNGNFEIEGL